MRILPAPAKPKKPEYELSTHWIPDRGAFPFDAAADGLPLRIRFELRRWNRERKIRQASPVIHLPATSSPKLLPEPAAVETPLERFERRKRERQESVRQPSSVIYLTAVAGGLKLLPAPRIAGLLPAPQPVAVVTSLSAVDRLADMIISAADQYAAAAGRAAYVAARQSSHPPFEVRGFAS